MTEFIGAHATEDDITRVIEVIKQRRKTLTQIAASSIVVGMSVQVVNIKPAALKGERGTVTTITRGSATVKFTKESTESLRWARSSRIDVPQGVEELEMDGIPLGCLRQI
ncbi:hypothetical protein ABT127_39115 [Streptomyces sp. NPDC001904]|uniref:hypothetical protein n=1 Tax=Streptomyces sp. NPDC001904 TaxID=3154531 RepID=UPI00332D1DE6